MKIIRLLFCLSVWCSAGLAGAQPTPSPAVPRHDRPYEVKELTRIPRIKSQVTPILPNSLVGVGGSATLSFVVTEKGTVAEVRLLKTTDHDVAQVMANALYQWKFLPGEINGVAVRTRMTIPMEIVARRP